MTTVQAHVVAIEGKTDGYAVARSELEPEMRHVALVRNASADLFSGDAGTIGEMTDALKDMAADVAAQDLSGASRMLMAQAISLDAMFAQMTRRGNLNLGQYPDAADRYMRLALKAQAQSRSTLETLVKMHQPREQTVRHIHVGPDGQAVFIENLHGGLGNARFDDQAHEQGASGPPLLSHDESGNGVPITSGEGKAAMPHARRGTRKRRPNRE